MADGVGELNFSQGIYVRINMKTDIFLSITSTTTKFGKQVHLQELS